MIRHPLTPFLLFALVCLLLPLIYIIYNLATPYDGARLDRGTTVFLPEGVELAPYETDGGSFQRGDILVAVDGVSLAERATAFFSPDSNGATASPVYTILRDGELLEIRVESGPYPWRQVLAEHANVFLFFLLSQGIALFVLLQRRRDPAARALFIWAFSGSHTYLWAFWLQASNLVEGASFWFYRISSTVLWLLFWAAVVHMLLSLTKNLWSDVLPSTWPVWLYLAPFVFFSVYMTLNYVRSGPVLVWWDQWLVGEYIVAVVAMLSSLVIMGIQLRLTQPGPDRMKIQWVLFGGLVTLMLAVWLFMLPALLFGQPLISPNWLGLVNYPFIIALGIAIWRHSLFDITFIIRRTVVYSLLTLLLAFLYFSLVTLSQWALTSQGEEHSSLVIVISTLAIAAAFNPLRIRIQNFIDLRFYRRRYDAEQALSDFAATARSETDLHALSDQLLDVVQDTVQPEQVALWLRVTHDTNQREA